MCVYATPLTIDLMKTKSKCSTIAIEYYIPKFINDVEIIAIPANHCPGAAMFIFKYDQ